MEGNRTAEAGRKSELWRERWVCGSEEMTSRTWAVIGRIVGSCPMEERRLFYFFIFSKTFFTEIYFQFHNLQFCTPAARQGAAGGLPPGSRAAGTYM